MNILGKEYKDKSGIYKIINLINNKYYIGSTVDLNRRSKEHKTSLKKNRHYSIKLQNAVNKYGLDNFKIEIIKLIDDISLVREFEEFYINFFDSVKSGYNCCNDVVSNNYLGESSKVPILCYDLNGNFVREFRSIRETCREIGCSNVGVYAVCSYKVGKCGDYIFRYKRENPPLKIDSYVHGNEGVVRTEEDKEKNRLAHTGIKHSEETKLKMSNSASGRKLQGRQLESACANLEATKKIKRSVVQIDKDSDKILNVFESLWSACEYLGKKNRAGDICTTCQGKQHTAFGYKWKYEDELEIIKFKENG